MNLYIYTRVENERILSCAKLFCNRMAALGCRCFSDESTVNAIGKNIALFGDEHPAEYVVSVGGDGTMLAAAQIALKMNLPVFGINAGRVGFLCAFDRPNILTMTVDDIKELVSSPRALLEVRCGGKFLQYALNEVAVTKHNYSRTVQFELMFGNNNMGTILGDGVIVATPTGSTGYSLSAGGPIVDSTLEALIVTPICSHSSFSRGHVLGKKESVKITPSQRFENDVQVSADGNDFVVCPAGTEISVTLSDRKLELLVSKNRNFYDILFKELSIGGHEQ